MPHQNQKVEKVWVDDMAMGVNFHGATEGHRPVEDLQFHNVVIISGAVCIIPNKRICPNIRMGKAASDILDMSVSPKKVKYLRIDTGG